MTPIKIEIEQFGETAPESEKQTYIIESNEPHTAIYSAVVEYLNEHDILADMDYLRIDVDLHPTEQLLTADRKQRPKPPSKPKRKAHGKGG